jgi:hypothetical protein
VSIFEIVDASEFYGYSPPSIDETTKAWIAGFFDGEGCASLGWKDSFQCRLTIANTHLESLELIQSFYGGKITDRTVRSNERAAYLWQIFGRATEVFAQDILPYSIVKAPQLRLFLYARTLLVVTNGLTSEVHEERRKVMDQMSELNRGRY